MNVEIYLHWLNVKEDRLTLKAIFFYYIKRNRVNTPKQWREKDREVGKEEAV